MTISMHSASVPIFARMLNNLLGWLDKAEAHATERKFDAAVLLGVRLAPDMLPLVNQVQIACDAAKFGVAQPDRKLADALDGVGEDLGVELIEDRCALELAHRILVVVEDDDVHEVKKVAAAPCTKDATHCARLASPG